MPFTVEVYNKETGICIDRIEAYEIRAEGDWYKIYPTFNEGYKGPKEYRIEVYELTTRSFLETGKTLMVKNPIQRTPQYHTNLSTYKNVDIPDPLQYMRVEYLPWGQDSFQTHMLAMSMVETWEEK